MTASPFGPLANGPRVETLPYFSPPYTGPVEPALSTSMLDRVEELETSLHIAETYAEIRAGVAMRALQQVAALQEMLAAAEQQRDLANQRVADVETVNRKREETIRRLSERLDRLAGDSTFDEPNLTAPGFRHAGYVPDTVVMLDDVELWATNETTPTVAREESGPNVGPNGVMR